MSDFARLMELAKEAGVTVAAPTVVDIPSVSGTGMVGEVLTCTMGNWNGMDAEPHSYAYQWMQDAVAPLGTDATYGIVAGDVGHSLTCVVTATNVAGSTAAPPSNAIVVDPGTREAPTAERAERSRGRS